MYRTSPKLRKPYRTASPRMGGHSSISTAPKRAKIVSTTTAGDHFFIGRQEGPPFVYALNHVIRESNIRFLCHDYLDKKRFEQLDLEEVGVDLDRIGSGRTQMSDTESVAGTSTASASVAQHPIIDLTLSDEESEYAKSPHAAPKSPPRKRPETGHRTTAPPSLGEIESRPAPNPHLFPFYIPATIKPAQPNGDPLGQDTRAGLKMSHQKNR